MVQILNKIYSILQFGKEEVFLGHHDQTIKDFGSQWLRYRDNEGYYGSLELFEDILSPFLKPDEIKGCKVAEIGSGTGRIVNMLLAAGAKHVIAVEPSDAFEVLCRNIMRSRKGDLSQNNGRSVASLWLTWIISSQSVYYIT